MSGSGGTASMASSAFGRELSAQGLLLVEVVRGVGCAQCGHGSRPLGRSLKGAAEPLVGWGMESVPALTVELGPSRLRVEREGRGSGRGQSNGDEIVCGKAAESEV